MDWNLTLAAKSVDDSETLLRILSASIAASGGWILIRSTSPEGYVHLSFEFEREACVEIYTVLMTAGLELSQRSHQQLAHLCHCTKTREASRCFEPARATLRILPEQLGVFDKKPGRAGGDFAYTSRT